MLCTLRRGRRLPRRNTRYRAGATPYPDRTFTGWNAPAFLTHQGWLIDSGLIHDEEIRRIEAEADAEIEAAVAFAEAGTLESVEELERFVTMERVPT